MTNDVDTTDGYLADVDGDGQLEIIAPPYTDVNNLDSNQPFTGFRIYKVEGSGYKFEKDSILDPTGRHDASGNFAVVDFETRTEPNRFSLEQVRDAGKSDDEEADGVVHVDIRQLRAPDNKPVNVDQIDPSTIVLDRNTRPLRVRHLHGESDDDDRKKNGGSLLRGEFSRQAVLRRLARQDLTKPLAPGDKVGISVRAKLKNGRTAGGTVHVTISRDNDHDDRYHE
jgi:hypothetical protein